MPFSDVSLKLAAEIIQAGTEQHLTIATAESCTGGLISACLTEIPGSSAVVDRGFVVYSNRAKQELLGVSPAVIEAHGAVSAETAEAMATGARTRAGVDLAIAVTGVAGPGGGSDEKPVGLVHLALATEVGTVAVKDIFAGDRMAVRAATLERALSMLGEAVARHRAG